eukprot:TRINITY_DN7109_c0_g2_i2.p1 TRINITY_DN7109_c0_g2~~TRINITY_DN7109_c0_g2_i2.p1  ORF type:complete len:543 (+),score=128.23 TRINITY_DN7109_c0_g2_i2:73-1701(+)
MEAAPAAAAPAPAAAAAADRRSPPAPPADPGRRSPPIGAAAAPADPVTALATRVAEAEAELAACSDDPERQRGLRWKLDKMRERLAALRSRQQQQQTGALGAVSYFPPPLPAAAPQPAPAPEGGEDAAGPGGGDAGSEGSSAIDWEEEEEAEWSDDEAWKEWGEWQVTGEDGTTHSSSWFACPLCGLQFGEDLLDPHLQGHFAAQAAEAAERLVRARGDAGAAWEEALEQQQAEIEKLMDKARSEAAERMGSLQQKRARQPAASAPEAMSDGAAAAPAAGPPRHRGTMRGRAEPKAAPAAAGGGAARRQAAPRMHADPYEAAQCPERMSASDYAELQELMRPAGGHGYPACWGGMRSATAGVSPGTREFKLVTQHFLVTLGGGQINIGRLTRLHNATVYGAYRRRTQGHEETIMYHGCRNSRNEESIISNGFQVSRCVSGGAMFGTWLAYIASYSDGGFAFDDSAGWRHLFICVCTRTDVRLDDRRVMRVVGQDCAYPMYLLTYRRAYNPGMRPVTTRVAAPAVAAVSAKKPKKNPNRKKRR